MPYTEHLTRESGIRAHFAFVVRHWTWLAAGAVLAGVVAGGLSALLTPQYRAEARLLLRRSPSEQVLVDRYESASDADRRLRNEVAFVESAVVRVAADGQYDGPLDVAAVTVEPGIESDVIDLAVVGPDAAEAAVLVNAYADAYVEVRRTRQIDDLLAAGSEITARLDAVVAELAAASAPLEALDAAVARGDETARARRDAMADELAPTLASLRSQEAYHREQLDQVQLSAGLVAAGGAEVVSPAEAPPSPVSPNVPRNVAGGAVAGVLLAVGACLLRDRLDDSITDKQVLEAVSGSPTLVLVPPFERLEHGVLTAADPASAGAEAYRSLRTSVKFLTLDRDRAVIQVVSAAAGEGKTETAANLAAAMASAGERVVLVGADLRRPRLHEVVGCRVTPGLTDVLAGTVALAEAVVPSTDVPGLHVLPAGFPPPNPSELLGGSRAADLVEQLANVFDTVIIDCAPLLPVTDGLVLSRLVDATLLVARHGSTTTASFSRAVELLRQVGAPLVGTVFNHVPSEHSFGMGYGSAPYAAVEPTPEPRRKVRRRGVKAGVSP